jgi:hypothetical protein
MPARWLGFWAILTIISQAGIVQADASPSLSPNPSPISSSAATIEEWTIFVYAAGDEPEVRASMLAAMQSMESIPSLRENRRVNLVVQHDDVGDDPNYRYRLQFAPPAPPGSPRLRTPPIAESEVRRIDANFRYRERNSGDPRTLKEFLSWGVAAYPARHYALLLIGHSWGIAGHMQDFHFDGQTYKRSSIITNYELRRILEEVLREQRALIPEGKLDALFIDSCIGGQFEVALELKDLVSYFFASSIETPYFGLDYSHAFDAFIRAVNAEGSFTPTQMHALLEELLRTMVATYVNDHAPGGPGVLQEQEYTPIAVFALRSEKLDAVARTFGALMSAINQTALPAEFRRGELPEIDRLRDSDGHADLLQLARVFDELLGRRAHESPAPAPALQRAQSWAQALIKSLSSGLSEAGPELLRVHHATARGAWLHLSIDPITPSPERAACDALRLFTLLNRQLPAQMLPQFADVLGQKLPITEFLCEGRPPATLLQLGSGGPQALSRLFDLRLQWPLAIPAHFTQLAATARSRLARRLSIWIDRGKRSVLDEPVLLSLPGMRDAVIEYVAADSPLAYLRERQHKAPVLQRDALQFTTQMISSDSTGSGLYVAEAHTSGTLYKHGLGILLKHTLGSELLPYFDGRSPIEPLEKAPYEQPVERYFDRLEAQHALSRSAYRDVDFYCLHRVRELGWADFLFGPDAARRCRGELPRAPAIPFPAP